jgi:hypothetical protein
MDLGTYVSIAELAAFTSALFAAFWIFSQSSKINFSPCFYITILCATHMFTSSYELVHLETIEAIGVHDFPDMFGLSLILLSMLSILWPM